MANKKDKQLKFKGQSAEHSPDLTHPDCGSNQEDISILYSERDRLVSIYSIPGWNNWAIVGVIASMAICLFEILTSTPCYAIDWHYVLIVAIGLVALLVIVAFYYPYFFPTRYIYYPNRISTAWDESPILDIVFSGLTYLFLSIMLITFSDYSWYFYLLAYLAIVRIVWFVSVCIRRNKLAYAGSKFNLIPQNKCFAIIQIVETTAIFSFLSVYSFISLPPSLSSHIVEIKISILLIGIWALVYTFFKINRRPQRILNDLDNIIERVVYGNLNTSEAIEELRYVRHGGNPKQIVRSELSIFADAMIDLSRLNDTVNYIINETNNNKLTSDRYYEWSNYLKVRLNTLENANNKCQKLRLRVIEISKIPNQAKYSREFNELIELIDNGFLKIENSVSNITTAFNLLGQYKNKYYCRKSGNICLDLKCKKRNDKMSIWYALKAFPLKYVIHLIKYRKL